jgi:hypothetical protein
MKYNNENEAVENTSFHFILILVNGIRQHENKVLGRILRGSGTKYATEELWVAVALFFSHILSYTLCPDYLIKPLDANSRPILCVPLPTSYCRVRA